MAAGSNQRRSDLVASKKVRVQNTTNDTVVKGSPGILHRVVVANAAAAVGTLTIADHASSSATPLIVIQVPANTTLSLQFDIPMAAGITTDCSATTIDALISYS